MNQLRFKTCLEVASNVAVLLVALIILSDFAWVSLARKTEIRLQAGLRKGKVFSLIPGVDYTKSSQTLIIALSSRCEHCNKSIPFFKQVLEANLENSNTTQIIAIFSETEEEVRRYISEQELSLNAAPGISPKGLNLPGTPSVVLISNEGEVLNFWIGEPSKDAEKEILDAIKSKT